MGKPDPPMTVQPNLLPLADHTPAAPVVLQARLTNLIQRCRASPRWASEEITALQAEVKAQKLEIIRLKDDLRFANNLLAGMPGA